MSNPIIENALTDQECLSSYLPNIDKRKKSYKILIEMFGSNKAIVDVMYERAIKRAKRQASKYYPQKYNFVQKYNNIKKHLGFGRYDKVPMMGNTHYYMCSEAYGHSDYNKFVCGTIGNPSDDRLFKHFFLKYKNMEAQNEC